MYRSLRAAKPRTEPEPKLDLGANFPNHFCNGAGPYATQAIPNFNLRTRAAVLIHSAIRALR